MAKKVLSIAISFLFIVGVISYSYGAVCAPVKKASDDGGPLKKLGRGAANFLTFPYEIPYRIGEANKSDGPYAAFTVGVVKGLTMSVYRALIGAYEILSFPLPIPEGYRPIITDPEFFFEQETY
ncbi:MAG: exosortase system-associated protein, TIGR04073 family [Candidatus Omnitrophica bacterium]|nr:exosortase system-associated protein, TIGR04073 family [Candidatus Omnitrophota bacterium]